MQPKVLSDVIEVHDAWGAKGYSVVMPFGGESVIYGSHRDAVEHARKEWPNLEDDLK